MPRVFRVPYGRTGDRRYSKYWYARINGKKVSLKTTDKRLAQRKAAEMERTTELGYDPDAIDRARKRPIIEHLVEFEDALVAKGVGRGHLKNLIPRLRRIIDECDIFTIGDVNAEKIESWLARLQKEGVIAAQTRKHISAAALQWGRWMVKSNRVTRNPFEGLKTNLNIAANRKHVRRTLTADECQILLATVRHSGERRGKMDPEQRYLCWAIMLTTGGRRNEVGSLTPESFQLDVDPPTMTIEAAEAKNRTCSRLPIRQDLAAELRVWLPTRQPRMPIFPIRNKQIQLALYRDLQDAGIERVNKDGRVIDVHGLRHYFVSALALAGAPVAITTTLARHSDYRLTMSVYTHLGLADLSKAVESMPAIGGRAQE